MEWLRLLLLLAAAYAVYSSHYAVQATLDQQGKLLAKLVAHNTQEASTDLPAEVRGVSERLGRVETALRGFTDHLTAARAEEVLRATEERLGEAIGGSRAEVTALAELVGKRAEELDGALKAGLTSSQAQVERALAALDAQAARLSHLEQLLQAAQKQTEGVRAPAAAALDGRPAGRAQPDARSPSPGEQVVGAVGKETTASNETVHNATAGAAAAVAGGAGPGTAAVPTGAAAGKAGAEVGAAEAARQAAPAEGADGESTDQPAAAADEPGAGSDAPRGRHNVIGVQKRLQEVRAAARAMAGDAPAPASVE